MDSLQSQLGSALLVEPQPPPPPQPTIDLPTPAILGNLDKFEPFPRLAVELQAKIWTHALEPHSIAPRVVRLKYNMSSSSYSYSFIMPPLLITCRLSRHLAQKYYPSLIPNLPHPLYFNTDHDFLYCTSTYDWSAISDQQEIFPILSILNESSQLGQVRFLVLDKLFWSHYARAGQLPTANGTISELRLFTNLEELFIAVQSLERHLQHYQRSFMRVVADAESKLDMLEAEQAAIVAYDATLTASAVPGFRIYQESKVDFLTRVELERNFGLRNLPYFGKTGPNWVNDAYSDKDSLGNPRRLLRFTEIRANPT